MELVADESLWAGIRKWVLAEGNAHIDGSDTPVTDEALLGRMRDAASRSLLVTPESVDKLAQVLSHANAAANHQMASYLVPGSGPIRYLEHVPPWGKASESKVAKSFAITTTRPKRRVTTVG